MRQAGDFCNRPWTARREMIRTIPDLTTLLAVLDLAAVAVFAISGALVASRKQMDIFGFIMLGTVTGIGGGTIRDVLLGVPVFWIAESTYLTVCIVTSAATFFAAPLLQSRYRAILWLDAIGLSVYCVLGTEKALAAGAAPVVAVAMGVITGTFGGIIRDILGGEVPLLLRRDVYVTAALVGAVLFVAAVGVGKGGALAWAIGVASCLVVRSLALVYEWSLPTYTAEPNVLPAGSRGTSRAV
jgi:uncharacterized membrane protein YeiH